MAVQRCPEVTYNNCWTVIRYRGAILAKGVKGGIVREWNLEWNQVGIWSDRLWRTNRCLVSAYGLQQPVSKAPAVPFAALTAGSVG